MKVITVVNDTSDFGFNLLRLSCALNGLQLVVLVCREDFSTNRIKDELLLDYLEEADDDEIILFTDGNDAVLIASEDEIMSKFRNAGSDLFFSAEMDCWPDVTMASQYPDVTTGPYRYLNSGGFIGKAALIKELLKYDLVDIEKFKRSNQYIWAQKYIKDPGKIKLDTNCDLFVTFTPKVPFLYSQERSTEYFHLMNEWFTENFDITHGRIFNKITNTQPCHAHFNGFSKWLLNDVVINMLHDSIPSSKHVQFFYEE